ncbi:MAG: 4Fe-4S dicluster domain-containing protein, partial [Desulfobacterales bacterium]|nr:4Fe-4S dicluster domain-containing protein [Desulfobacterales bacterium]
MNFIFKMLLKYIDEPAIRLTPPGASEDFFAKCIRCGQCVEACQYHSIVFDELNHHVGRMGTPYIDPLSIPCYLTMEC